MHLAEIQHQLFLFRPIKWGEFSLHFQKMRRTQLAGVEMTKKQEEGVPFLPQFRRNLFRKASSHHVQQSPAHVTKFLPRYFVLSLFDECSSIFIFFLLRQFRPKWQHLGAHDLLAIGKAVFNETDGGEYV
jgi:hypothetical protein